MGRLDDRRAKLALSFKVVARRQTRRDAIELIDLMAGLMCLFVLVLCYACSIEKASADDTDKMP